MSDTIKILIGILNIIFLSIGILTSIAIFILIFSYRRQSPINTSVLLICNTYLFILLSSSLLLDTCARNFYGDLYENISFVDWWCYGRAYLLHVTVSSIYFSYLLQAIFRLFRIVFYRHRRLQNLHFILRLIVLQWFFAFLLISPALFLHYFQYIPHIYYCPIPLINLQGTIFSSIAVYYGPTLVTSIIYSYIMYYIKYRTPLLNQQNLHGSNQRDLVVLRRIILLVAILLILIFPTLVLWINYIVTGYLHPLIYHIEALTISVSLFILPIASAILNPQLRRLLSITCGQHRRIHPVMVIQQQATNLMDKRE